MKDLVELTRLLALGAQNGYRYTSYSVHVVLDAELPKQHELGADVLIDYRGSPLVH